MTLQDLSSLVWTSSEPKLVAHSCCYGSTRCWGVWVARLISKPLYTLTLGIVRHCRWEPDPIGVEPFSCNEWLAKYFLLESAFSVESHGRAGKFVIPR